MCVLTGPSNSGKTELIKLTVALHFGISNSDVDSMDILGGYEILVDVIKLSYVLD